MFAEHANTGREYDGELSEDGLASVLHRFSMAESLRSGLKRCYIYGMGAHPRSTYARLMGRDGISVVWTASVLPGPARILSRVVASHAGLVRVDDPALIPETFSTLVHASMAGLYLFHPSLEDSFVSRATAAPGPTSYDLGVKEDSGYLIYVVDADSAESGTGMYEIVSHGIGAPPDLLSALGHSGAP